MRYNIVEGCVVSICQLHDHRIRREGMMEIANLDRKSAELNVERRDRGKGGEYILSNELETTEGYIILNQEGVFSCHSMSSRINPNDAGIQS